MKAGRQSTNVIDQRSEHMSDEEKRKLWTAYVKRAYGEYTRRYSFGNTDKVMPGRANPSKNKVILGPHPHMDEGSVFDKKALKNKATAVMRKYRERYKNEL